MQRSEVSAPADSETLRPAAIRHAQRHLARHLAALSEFCAIPSISADPNRREDVAQAAAWLAAQLESIGVRQSRVIPTPGHPIVYGELAASRPGQPTVLVYGHYDVQPDGPLEPWESKPFIPANRGEFLFARGAADMKGPLYATIAAVEAMLQQGSVPVNIKFIFEGEEETGSPNLGPFLEAHKTMLAADVCLNLDAGLLDYEAPTITYGLRGIVAMEIRVHGPRQDVHSGIFGGVVHNPAEVLARLIAALRDGGGGIAIPGFYDGVRLPDETERAELARLPITEASILEQTGVPALWGEPGFSPVERAGGRPTLEVNGLVSGCAGDSFATIIPASALARISFRLVPDQDPELVSSQLTRYLETLLPSTVRLEVKLLAGSPAILGERTSPATRALDRALAAAWEKPPYYQRGGGGIPIVSQMQSILGISSVLSGLAGPGDSCHGPNERLHLPTFERGIEAVIHFLHNFAQS